MSNKKKMNHVDVFTRVDADVARGAEVTSKSFEEDARYQQELLNQIDVDMQKQWSGIKAVEDQFPGECSDNYINNQIVLESDKLARKNQLASEYIEKRLQQKSTKKLSGEKVSSNHTATVAVIHDNSILMGQRRDNGKWTFPGGGCNDGEEAHAGAVRELWEEAGVRCKGLEHLGSKEVSGRTGNKINVHCFKLALDKKIQPTSHNDPDNEVAKWQWVDFKNGIDPQIMIELQSPKNLLLQHLGLQE